MVITMIKDKEAMLDALRGDGYEDDTRISYENIVSASYTLEKAELVDVSIVERTAEGDSWYEALYHSKRVGKTIIMSHDFSDDYEDIEEFVDAIIELQKECDAFEKPEEVDIPLMEGELQELMEGKHFHWSYAGGVHLFLCDNDDGEASYNDV
jgi:3-dehydroquinate dehydratase